MTTPRHPTSIRGVHRGLSLVELMLSLTITVIVAGAIASMMAAVGTGVGSRRDVRTTMIHASATQSRLNAYIAPSRCLLDLDGTNLVLWLNDQRPSDTVHATELRWLKFDADRSELTVHYVTFPETWSNTTQDLADRQFPKNSDWDQVYQQYDSNGHISSFQLDEGISSLIAIIDQASAQSSRHLVFEISYADQERTIPVTMASTIRFHDPPLR